MLRSALVNRGDASAFTSLASQSSHKGGSVRSGMQALALRDDQARRACRRTGGLAAAPGTRLGLVAGSASSLLARSSASDALTKLPENDACERGE
jgi:hypothetical protein